MKFWFYSVIVVKYAFMMHGTKYLCIKVCGFKYRMCRLKHKLHISYSHPPPMFTCHCSHTLQFEGRTSSSGFSDSFQNWTYTRTQKFAMLQPEEAAILVATCRPPQQPLALLTADLATASSSRSLLVREVAGCHAGLICIGSKEREGLVTALALCPCLDLEGFHVSRTNTMNNSSG